VVPFGNVVGSWFVPITPIGSAITFPTVVTFTSNGQFIWQQTNLLTGVLITVQGSYTVGPLLPLSSEFYLTMVSQGQIVLQGLYAQPGPGEFIIETFATWPLVGGPNTFLFTRQ
jgi:hypothetical protein